MTILELLFPYVIFFNFLCILFIIPTRYYRLVYLHSLSIIFLIPETPMRPYILLSMLHSAIHHLWPFIDTSGYNIKETPFFDVLCHFIMMIWSYGIINEKISNPVFQYLTLFWGIGSLFNIIISLIPVKDYKDHAHTIFAWTSITQAISTGYWISTMLYYPNLINHPLFIYHWLFWIGLACVNWIIYKRDHSMIAKSMELTYIESVFIVCTWVPTLTSYMYLN